MTVFKTFLKILNKNKFVVLLYTIILLIFGVFNMTTSENNTNFIAVKPDILIINKDEEIGLTKNLVDYIKDNSNIINIKLEDAYYGLEKKISLRNVKGKMTTFTVKVPAGIRNGEKIRLIGQGKEGIRGGKNGDLFIRINIQKNDKFKLEGCDLVTDLYLTPWEAALGKEVNINAMEENIMIKVPAGIQSGERIKIEDKGYKDGQGGRGSLIAEVKTVVPKQLTEQEQDLFKKLEEISTFNPRDTLKI